MSLEKFYELRENFIILGLTGKMQAGADKIVEILSQDQLSIDNTQFINSFPEFYKNISNSEASKYRRLKDFYNYKENWKQFDIIEYKNVVLLFILEENYNSDLELFASNIAEWIKDLGNSKVFEYPKFCSEKGLSLHSTQFILNDFKSLIFNSLKIIPKTYLEALNTKSIDKNLKDNLKENDIFFSKEYGEFAYIFFNALDSFSIYLRHKLIHIVSYCIRRFGTLNIDSIKNDQSPNGLPTIYAVAEVINSIIKCHRKKSNNKAHIIIDRLKNSYELNYFREKYSGYYTVSINRNEEQRQHAIKDKIDKKNSKTNPKENAKLLHELDNIEYLISEYKGGSFEGFDIENCVQKADYHIWYEEELDNLNVYNDFYKKDGVLKFKDKVIDRTNKYYIYQPLLIQILKLTALIKQPGLITPSYIERMMQIAYNTKLNSGCISRQVGAVVTDKHFSVKGIGWNEVAHGQAPCSSRDIRDFEAATISEDISCGFTQFEIGKTNHTYKDNKSFKEKLSEDINKVKDELEENLKGRPCSFCFKSHHNAYEAKENQVHTRSLHAEENAMLQISKYGGQPLLGGNLFTTASTCELCAKKAYQLGIKNIFYIDVYPGISNEQILNNGSHNIEIYAYQGAIGRGFNKIYESLMSQKDETTIRTGFKATISQKEQATQLQKIIGSKISKKSEALKNHLNKLKDDDKIIDKIVELLEKGLGDD